MADQKICHSGCTHSDDHVAQNILPGETEMLRSDGKAIFTVVYFLGQIHTAKELHKKSKKPTTIGMQRARTEALRKMRLPDPGLKRRSQNWFDADKKIVQSLFCRLGTGTACGAALFTVKRHKTSTYVSRYHDAVQRGAIIRQRRMVGVLSIDKVTIKGRSVCRTISEVTQLRPGLAACGDMCCVVAPVIVVTSSDWNVIEF